MSRNKLLLCALLSLLITGSNAQMRSLPPRFVSWMESPNMRHATVALEIVDLTAGEVCYQLDVQRAVQPASLLKLVTTGAALRTLGGDYVIPDSICCIDSTKAPLPELVGYNPDWCVEDVASSYAEALTYVPDAGMSLRDYARKTNEESLNIHAEALAYLMAADTTLASGIDSIRTYWTNRGLDTESLVMYDACGLAPADRVTAHMMSQLLSEMQYDEDFRQSLAVAGRTGTVIYFLKSSRLAGRAQLKTGTTKSVVAYAGYVHGSDDHWYSVVLIVNNSTEHLTVMRKNIEKMFILLIP